MKSPGSILITGASRGIGLEACRLLLEEGWRVTGTTRKSAFPEDVLNHANFSGITVDLAKSDFISVLDDCFSDENLPDVVVNNAGIFEPVLFDSSDDEWDQKWQKMLDVNLIVPAKICKKAVQAWKSTKREGHIINVSSRAAYRGETAEYSSYAASKGGLTALTKTIARGFGRDKIYAYTIAPGFVHTDMATESIEVYGEEYITKDLALDAIVPPQDVASLIGMLASGKLRHMTGQTLHMNSGSYFI
jgi:3-oxoacyl-[acyl-carrier protein] reductase